MINNDKISGSAWSKLYGKWSDYWLENNILTIKIYVAVGVSVKKSYLERVCVVAVAVAVVVAVVVVVLFCRNFFNILLLLKETV